MNAILTGIKIIYTDEIMKGIKNTEKQQYFYEMINSIPENLFDSKNPLIIKKNGTKLAKFITSLNQELKQEMDISNIIKRMDDQNKEQMTILKRQFTGGLLK